MYSISLLLGQTDWVLNNTRLPYKLQVLPNKTGTSSKHVFVDENIPLSSPLVVFSIYLVT